MRAEGAERLIYIRANSITNLYAWVSKWPVLVRYVESEEIGSELQVGICR